MTQTPQITSQALFSVKGKKRRHLKTLARLTELPRTSHLTSTTRTGQGPRPNRVLALLSTAFFLGGLLGCALGGWSSTEGMVGAFLVSAQAQVLQPTLWRTLLVVFRWPGAVLLLGCLPRAALTVPVLVFWRGVALSCGVASLVLGQAPVWCVGLLFGPSCLLALPVLFILAEGVLCQSNRQSPGLAVRVLVSVPVLTLCVVLEQAAVPPLLTWYLSS